METDKKHDYEAVIDLVTEADNLLYHRRRDVEKIIIDEATRKSEPFSSRMSRYHATRHVRNELKRMFTAITCDSYSVTLWDEGGIVAEEGFIQEVGVDENKDGEKEVYVKGLYSVQNENFDRQFKVGLNSIEELEEVLRFIMTYD